MSRIVGLLDGVLTAQIDLDYSSQGSLAKAVGKSLDNPKPKVLEVSYAYDSSGRLAGVTSTDGTVGYGYKDSWVTSVTWADKAAGAQPKTLNTFDYNERGQVMSETHGQRTFRHALAAVSGGVEASVARAAAGGAQDFVRYDTQMRPVEARDADGTHTAWSYKSDGSVETTVTTPDNRKVTVVDTADGRQRTLTAVGIPSLVAQFDVGGNLTSLAENQRYC